MAQDIRKLLAELADNESCFHKLSACELLLVVQRKLRVTQDWAYTSCFNESIGQCLSAKISRVDQYQQSVTGSNAVQMLTSSTLQQRGCRAMLPARARQHKLP
ncbi:hypothetical protein ABBQ32_004332 [Trebouxia sp. C0010 RCD-2024]